MIIEPGEVELLDRFAIAAMSAILTSYKDECAFLTMDYGLVSNVVHEEGYCELVAASAYKMAEKMLFERQVLLECSEEERRENADKALALTKRC